MSCRIYFSLLTGVLLGVALRHGISPNVRMSAFFWHCLSRGDLKPYSSPSEPEKTATSTCNGNSKAGHRVQELYSGVREACARALRHGVVSTLPEVGCENETCCAVFVLLGVLIDHIHVVLLCLDFFEHFARTRIKVAVGWRRLNICGALESSFLLHQASARVRPSRRGRKALGSIDDLLVHVFSSYCVYSSRHDLNSEC
jgi:hypothetical protein